MTSNWWKKSTVYQVYPKSFQDSNGDGIGDIQGLISRLDYIANLGIDTIWLSPVYENSNADNGYDISDYKKIDAQYGTMEDMDSLINEIKSRDMKLVMDLVANHTSDEHHWFKESRKSKDNPYRDFYIWRPGKKGSPPTDWKASFGGPAWKYDEHTEEYYLHMFSEKQPDLNWENPNMRNKIYEIMEFWINKGIDGFRMDVISMISKKELLASYDEFATGNGWFKEYSPNQPTIHIYLKEMNEKVLSKHDLMTVGECPKITPEDALKITDPRQKELNMVFQNEHMRFDRVKGKSKWEVAPLNLPELKKNLSKWQKVLGENGWNSLYWNNHDQPRIVSRFGDDSPKYREVSAKMLAHVLHFMKGTPYVYQGEELGLTNPYFESIEDYRDIETLNWYEENLSNGKPVEEMMKVIQEQSRDNGRTPMQWTTDYELGFTTGQPWIKRNNYEEKITAMSQINDPNSVYSYYKKLISIRKKMDILIDGDFNLIDENNEELFIYERKYLEEEILIIANWTNSIQKAPFKPKGEVLLSNYEALEIRSEELILRPYEAITFYQAGDF